MSITPVVCEVNAKHLSEKGRGLISMIVPSLGCGILLLLLSLGIAWGVSRVTEMVREFPGEALVIIAGVALIFCFRRVGRGVRFVRQCRSVGRMSARMG